MSQPMQKLHEVLDGIVADENIEISLIDSSKEFAQFVGSSGQCLVVFSNPKICVTFLQENRIPIAKSHSKVILLTPKEIPSKTLVKFVKLGLTEAILDNSPPKTLLYKVKLLLRSIKSTSATQEDKNRVVKSSQDATAASTEQNDLPALKNENDESLDTPTEEKSKKFINDEDNVIDYGGRLKGKNKYQEETIETNWKSKRKTDSLDMDTDASPDQKVEEEDSDNIDMYYRGKKKNGISVELEEAYSQEKKSKNQNEEIEDDASDSKSNLNIELEDGTDSKKKRAFQEEEADSLFVKKNKEEVLELTQEDDSPREKFQNEEEKEVARKKELAELDALIEAAKEKQAKEVEDLGGYYEGKIDNNKLDLELEEEEEKAKKEYDNSELFEEEKKKADLLLTEAAPERNRQGIQEELDDEKEKRRKGELDDLSENMTGEGGDIDRISTLMMSDITTDSSKKLTLEEGLDLQAKEKTKAEEEIDSDDRDKKETNIELMDGDADDRHKKLQADEEFELDSYKKESLELDGNDEDDARKALIKEEEESGDDLDKDKSSSDLQLAEGSAERSRTSSEAEESDISLKKLKQFELGIDEAGGDKKPSGKVDQIDTFYRSGEAKKVEHSWDNLTSRTNSLNLDIEKATRGEDEEGSILPKKDLGEITIDYRKLKEEFDFISKHGAPGEEGSINERSARAINDSDDEGTFKVIELDTRGFEFGIEMINLIYQKDTKPQDFYRKISEELISQYKGHAVFYTYKANDKKHTEAFDSFMHFGDSLVPLELKEWWINAKTEKDRFDHYFEKTMTTWLCRDIPDKTGKDSFWEDVELPTWAANELTNKKVEMIFPYFDGVDRMGVAIIIFPTGVNPAKDKSIMVTLETIRTILLESIQRKLAVAEDKSQNDSEAGVEKKNIMSMFSGLFNKNKAS